MDKTTVTQQNLVAGLRELGVAPGDVVFVHASLKRFGHVEGGEETVVQALLETVGPAGTVAMPGFTFQLNIVPEPVFDVLHTPCWTGRIYEQFRLNHAAYRSHHCTHSVCAVGARAAELTETHSVQPCGAESPFVKLAEWQGKIILLGVSHNSNTTFHAVEEREKLSYMEFRELPGATIVDELGEHRPLPTQIHAPTRRYDFNRMDEPLRREGIQRQGYIGDSLVRVIAAGEMLEYTAQAVRQDAEALLMTGTERMSIEVGREGTQIVQA